MNAQPAAVPVAPHRKLGDLLVERRLATPVDVAKALAFQQQFGGRLGSILVRLGALSEESLISVLSSQLQVPLLEADERPADVAAFRELAESSGLLADWWIDNGVAAWRNDDGKVLVIARDLLDPSVNEILSRHLANTGWQWRLARTQDLERFIDMFSRSSVSEEDDLRDDVSHLRELAEEAPVIELVNNILAQAMDQRASDVHIEPEEQLFHVRLRIDGILHTRLTLPIGRYPAVASRVKLISGMDIAERRLPQDGRLSTRVSGHDVDIRASSVPAVHGESLVLRLLPKERKDLSLGRLGMSERDLALFRGWAREPHGIVLVTGPTGSGKSTTLYGTLEEVNDRDRKIITVEDPVEYQVRGVTQIQASADIALPTAGATLSGADFAITTPIKYAFSAGEVRHARIECSENVQITTGAVTAAGFDVGAINGLGTSAIYFSLTAQAATATTDTVSIDGTRTLTQKQGAVCSFALYDTPSQSANGGTSGRINASYTSGDYIRFASAWTFTSTGETAIANVEADPAFGAFLAQSPATSANTVARLAAMELELVTGVKWIDGTDAAWADFFNNGAAAPTGAHIRVNGDFSAADTTYLSAAQNCSSTDYAGVIASGGNSATYRFGATPPAAPVYLCFSVDGDTAVPEATYTATALSGAAIADQAVASTKGPLAAGEIGRNGTTLQATLAQRPAGYYSRIALVNTGSMERTYTIKIISESGHMATNGPTLTGSIPANSMIVRDINDLADASNYLFTGANRAAVEVTVAAPDKQIQGMYQLVNPTNGALTNAQMVRPGTN